MGARRAAVVLLLLALPFGAAACGGGKKSSSTTTTSASSPLDAVRAAAEKTAKAGSMQLALTAAATGSTTIAVAGAGGFDTTNHQGKLHLHFSTSGISSTLDVVLSGTDLYVSSPLFSLALPAGKSWIKLDLTKSAQAAGVDLSSLLSQDPTQALDALESASTVVAGRHRQARRASSRLTTRPRSRRRTARRRPAASTTSGSATTGTSTACARRSPAPRAPAPEP